MSKTATPTGPFHSLDIEWNETREAYTVAETATHWVDIVPMLFTYRVVLTPKSSPMTYDVGWCYETFLAAAAAVAVWDRETEPEPIGYIKRVGGDPT